MEGKIRVCSSSGRGDPGPSFAQAERQRGPSLGEAALRRARPVPLVQSTFPGAAAAP